MAMQRLSRGIRCKGCGKRFRFTPEASEWGKRITLKHRLLNRWNAASGGAKLSVVAAAAALCIVIGVVVGRVPRTSQPIPTTLVGRSAFVGQAFARNGLADLQAISKARTGRYVKSWLRQIRPAEWWQELPPNFTPDVSVKVLYENRRTGAAASIAEVRIASVDEKYDAHQSNANAESGSQDGAAAGRSNEITAHPGSARSVKLLYWRIGSDGNWWLAADETYDALTKTGDGY
jgi:hypothetical protein